MSEAIAKRSIRQSLKWDKRCLSTTESSEKWGGHALLYAFSLPILPFGIYNVK